MSDTTNNFHTLYGDDGSWMAIHRSGDGVTIHVREEGIGSTVSSISVSDLRAVLDALDSQPES